MTAKPATEMHFAIICWGHAWEGGLHAAAPVIAAPCMLRLVCLWQAGVVTAMDVLRGCWH
jgi:hypothetical protein